MKRDKFYIIMALLGVMLFASSCEKEDWTYQGPQYYEFSAELNGQGVRSNLVYKENSLFGLDSIAVQLMKHSTEKVVVNYRIVEKVYYLTDKDRYVTKLPADADPNWVEERFSEAEYGTDYEIVTSTGATWDPTTMRGSVTIPAGEYFGYIEVDLLVKSGKTFYVELIDSDEHMANKPTSLFGYVISPDKVIYLEESFMSGLPSSWSVIDRDGDGYGWEFYANSMTSDSYRSGAGLYPENYLVSPAVTIPSNIDQLALTFELASGANGVYEENYRIVVSEDPITFENCRDATVVRDWTELLPINKGRTFTLESLDLTDYKGKTFYFAFVHGNCYDVYFIMLRNVTLYSY